MRVHSLHTQWRVILTLALLGLSLSSCSFFNPDDPPHPIWGVWAGKYPDVLSTQPDSARWVFTSNGVYLFYALKSSGGILTREIGYYNASGMLLVLSADRAGEIEREELHWEATMNELTVYFNWIPYRFERRGSPEDADTFHDLFAKHARHPVVGESDVFP